MDKTHRSLSETEAAPADRISVDPDVRGGVPCIGDGHWPISHILERLASGASVDDLLQVYPDLTPADIRLALDAAAWVMRDPTIDWTELNLPAMVEFQDEMRAWESLSNDQPSLMDDSPED